MRRSFTIVESLLFLMIMALLAGSLIQVSQSYIATTYSSSTNTQLYTSWQNLLSYISEHPDDFCPTSLVNENFFSQNNIIINTNCNRLENAPAPAIYTLDVTMSRGLLGSGDFVQYQKTLTIVP